MDLKPKHAREMMRTEMAKHRLITHSVSSGWLICREQDPEGIEYQVDGLEGGANSGE